MFRSCTGLLAGMLRPTAPALMAFRPSAPLRMMKPTAPALMLKPTAPALMLKATTPALGAPIRTEARTVKGRRLAPQSTDHMGRGFKRQKVWQYRFVEKGGPYDRVWLALGGKMKRRRIGRPTAVKDLRYYWRPIEQSAQRTYQARLRLRSRSNTTVRPMRLHAGFSERGRINIGPLAKFQPVKRRFAGNAPPERQDFEFRVF